VKQFQDLSKKGQIERLRPIAFEACRAFGIDAKSIRLVFHGFNTTFRIQTPEGKKHALRINVCSESSLGQLAAEVGWVRALELDGRVGVASPIPTPAGQFVVSIPGPLGRPVNCVLYSWLEGTLAKRVATPVTVRLLSQATAELHRQATEWSVPSQCQFKPLPDLFYGHPFALPQTSVFARTYQKAAALFNKLQQRPRIPVHYDLHLGNAKVHKGRLFIFDFDDAVLAWPILDLAVTIHSLRRRSNGAELEEAYWHGLDGQSYLQDWEESDFESLVAIRGLFIANEILSSIHPEFRQQAARQVEQTQRWLEDFEKTGRYDPSS
jgi:Ser/Thr protein kinase RdoA (MazF antagonist)